MGPLVTGTNGSITDTVINGEVRAVSEMFAVDSIDTIIVSFVGLVGDALAFMYTDVV